MRNRALALFKISLLALATASCGAGETGMHQNSADRELSWAPPSLDDPLHLSVDAGAEFPTFIAGRDYVIELTEPIRRTGGLELDFKMARNVVIVGGEINVQWAGPYEASTEFGLRRRGLLVKDWSGTLHIEGLWIHGNDLAEGINVSTTSDSAILQLQNVRVDRVAGRPEEAQCYTCPDVKWHPDILQNWNGPRSIRIDGLSGSTDCQGLMVQPGENDPTLDAREISLRRINITKSPGSSCPYTVYSTSSADIIAESVWLSSSPGEWHPAPPPSGVFFERLPHEDYVPAGRAGMRYESPGYGGE